MLWWICHHRPGCHSSQTREEKNQTAFRKHTSVSACTGGYSIVKLHQKLLLDLYTYLLYLIVVFLIQDYSAVINSLPERDLPSFFGLPANIDRSSQRNISNQVISQLRVLKRSPSAGDKFDREAWSTELNPILAVWKKLNQVHVQEVYCVIGSELHWGGDFAPPLGFGKFWF